MAASAKKKSDATAPVAAGPAIGELVWFADRSNGRTTEHLGKVAALGPAGALTLVVRDNGEDRTFEDVKPWTSGATRGWWRARR